MPANVMNSNEKSMEFIDQKLAEWEQQGLRRTLRTITGRQGREIEIDGKRVLNFCSNNYLGLADDPRLCDAAMSAIRQEGLGAGASRLVCGTLASHPRLEQRLAEFKGTESALVFNSGYQANVGILSALCGRGDTVFSDRLNHASIIDGILLSGARMSRYPHGDMAALEDMLKSSSAGQGRRLIVTDSVFSMDGDIAPLKDIAALAERYNSMLMVDEAHAVGVLGQNGRGAVEHFGLTRQVDIQMGTLSKAVGAFGAYVCGSRKLIDFLVNCSRSFIYSTALPPAIAAAARQGLDIIESDPARRERLWENTRFLLSGLRDLGLDTRQSATPIIPVVVGDNVRAVEFSKRLLASGIYAAAIRPPTVPANSARLRISVMATHTRQDLEFLLSQTQRIKAELCPG